MPSDWWETNNSSITDCKKLEVHHLCPLAHRRFRGVQLSVLLLYKCVCSDASWLLVSKISEKVSLFSQLSRSSQWNLSFLNSLKFQSEEMKQMYQTMWNLLIRAPGCINKQSETWCSLLDMVVTAGLRSFHFGLQVMKDFKSSAVIDGCSSWLQFKAKVRRYKT